MSITSKTPVSLGPLSPKRQMLQAVLKAFNANKTSWIGLVIFLVIALMAIFAPWVTGQDPLEQDILARLKPPTEAHLLGTDYFGRDIYSRIIYGARLSLLIGLTSTALAMVIGSAIGMIAGWYGGRIDTLVM
jgi:peptide/nickel transport system permease protein